MSPRKSQQGASASARKAPVRRRASGAASSRTSTSSRASASTRTSPKKPKASKKQAHPARSKRDASWFRWWLLPPIVVAAIAVFVVTYYPVARVQYRETRQRSALQAELSSLQARNHHLSTEVARLKTPEGVEDYARSQLGMVKRGEHIVVVTEGTSRASKTMTIGVSPQIDTSDIATTAPRGPWTAFLDSVFNVK
jgi:cell division protein FtsL